MIRSTIAVIVGLIVWGICATCLDLLLRHALPGYAAAEPQMQFTTGMMLARLALPGAIPSLAAGFSSTWVSPRSGRVTAVLIGILLLFFLPSHYYLWTKFPVWQDVRRSRCASPSTTRAPTFSINCLRRTSSGIACSNIPGLRNKSIHKEILRNDYA